MSAQSYVESTLINDEISKKSNKTHHGKFKKFLQTLIFPYFKSEEKAFAYSALCGILVLNLIGIGFSVLMNKWNREFFDSLQNVDYQKFKTLLLTWVSYMLILVVVAMVKGYLHHYYCFRWRKWQTKFFVQKWLDKKLFYKIAVSNAVDNPDQRISNDIGGLVSGVVSFSLVTFNSTINVITFGTVLWGLSPAFTIPWFASNNVEIPHYMVWFCFLYSAVLTLIMFKMAKPFVKLEFNSQKVEADFRFSLMQINKHHEEVALLGGENDERLLLGEKFKAIWINYKQILMRSIPLNLTQEYASIATGVIPLLVSAPLFFSGKITLGILTQLTSAFGMVQGSLMVFAMSAQNIAGLRANANRLTQFLNFIPEHMHSNLHRNNADKSMEIQNVTLYKPSGEVLMENVNFSVQEGEKILLKGRSGLGKTSLIKAINGLWCNGKGTLLKPSNIEYVPQKPYFPVVSLKNAILYGNSDKNIPNDLIQMLLNDFNLKYLTRQLEETNNWNITLSLGEQQRLNLVRIILKKPAWLILDEPTASLDQENEISGMQKLFIHLKSSTILTISHSTVLEPMHDRVINLDS